jgi:hypothetical protein
MKKSLLACSVLIVLGGVFSLPPRSSGQQKQEKENQPGRYRLVDLGALGGPNSYQPFGYAGSGNFLTEASLSGGEPSLVGRTPPLLIPMPLASLIVLSITHSSGKTASKPISAPFRGRPG